MSISQNEIIFKKSEVNDDSPSNGGRLSTTEIISDVVNNVWPDASQSERSSGSTKYRKIHIHNTNASNLTLIRPRLFVAKPTDGDDMGFIFGGTPTDTQATKNESRLYGVGSLDSNLSLNDASMSVLTEGAVFDIFRNGDLIRVSDKVSVDSVIGNEEYVTISSSPVYVGNVATFNISSPIKHNYSANLTMVSSVYEPADVRGLVSNVVKTLGGTFNDTTYPILIDNIGSISQTVTLTFTTSTAFNAVSNVLGSLGSGTIGANFSPVNSDYARPLFTVFSAAWGGTQVPGNSLVFTTTPSALAYWEKLVIPAGCGSLSGNSFILGLDAESS